MDQFGQIKELEGVSGVYNFYARHSQQPLDLVFWTCPQMMGSKRRNRIKVNETRTALYTPGYGGIQEGSLARVERVQRFSAQLGNVDVTVGSLTNIFGAADALILFAPNPVTPPDPPELEIKTISNYGIVLHNFDLWRRFYGERPWQGAPTWAVQKETERLFSLLPSTVPKNLAYDFVRRIFAGFSLDGYLLRRGDYGLSNPVIVGVESKGVPVLQNAALDREDWLPVIQLN